jgi:hypothetical protein
VNHQVQVPVDNNNEDVILDSEPSEDDVVEGVDDEDIGFDVMEFDHTSDVHARRQAASTREKERLLQEQWTVAKRCAATNRVVNWKLVEESIPTTEPVEVFETIGVRGMNWRKFEELKDKMKQHSKETRNSLDATIPFLSVSPFFDLFILLWPGDWKYQLYNLNSQILTKNESNRRNQSRTRPITLVSENEFFVFLGIMVAAVPAGKGGAALFKCSRKRYNSGVRKISAPVN